MAKIKICALILLCIGINLESYYFQKVLYNIICMILALISQKTLDLFHSNVAFQKGPYQKTIGHYFFK